MTDLSFGMKVLNKLFKTKTLLNGINTNIQLKMNYNKEKLKILYSLTKLKRHQL